MPTKPPTPSAVVKVTLVHGLGTDIHIGSGCFWSYSGGVPTAGNLNSIATGIGTAWNGQLSALMSANGLLEQVTVEDLASATGATGVSTTAHAGTRTGAAPTVAACAQLNLSIARKYRGGKPKIFLPFGVTTDMSGEAAWSSTFFNLVTAAWASFQTAVNGLTGGPITLGNQVNVSYYSGSTTNPNSSKWSRRNIPALRGTPVVDTITAAQCRQKLGSQRRRIRAS